MNNELIEIAKSFDIINIRVSLSDTVMSCYNKKQDFGYIGRGLTPDLALIELKLAIEAKMNENHN